MIYYIKFECNVSDIDIAILVSRNNNHTTMTWKYATYIICKGYHCKNWKSRTSCNPGKSLKGQYIQRGYHRTNQVINHYYHKIICQNWLSPLLQTHLHSRLNTWFQWIWQRRLQADLVQRILAVCRYKLINGNGESPEAPFTNMV